MKTNANITQTLAAAALLAMAATPLCAQHVNAGAIGQNQGDKLFFVNGSTYADASGYVRTMTFTNGGTYAGLFGSGPTFTAAPSITNFTGVAEVNAAANGSFLQLRMESVTGPAGATFSFWDTGATAPSFSLTSGSTTPSGLWFLSDPTAGPDLGFPAAGTPGGDPYGHLHGRRFTADMLGDYVVGFKIFDTSTNGAGGGAIHTPSDTYFLHFQAVPEPSTYALAALGAATAFVMWRRKKSAK